LTLGTFVLTFKVPSVSSMSTVIRSPGESPLGLKSTYQPLFEVQFTAGGFGWIVVHLEGIERDELAELVFEAWRLTAPARLREQRGNRLPV